VPIEKAIEQLKQAVDLQKVFDHDESLQYLEVNLAQSKEIQMKVK